MSVRSFWLLSNTVFVVLLWHVSVQAAVKDVSALDHSKICVFKQINMSTHPDYAYGHAEVFSERANINLTIIKTVPASRAFIQSAIYMKNVLGESFRMIVPGRKIKLCSFVGKPKIDPFLQMFVKNWQKYTDLLSKCPVPMGNYIVRDYIFVATGLPAFVPLGTYVSTIAMFDYDDNLYKMIYKLSFLAEIRLKPGG